jgi:hypothetical protein
LALPLFKDALEFGWRFVRRKAEPPWTFTPASNRSTQQGPFCLRFLIEKKRDLDWAARPPIGRAALGFLVPRLPPVVNYSGTQFLSRAHLERGGARTSGADFPSNCLLRSFQRDFHPGNRMASSYDRPPVVTRLPVTIRSLKRLLIFLFRCTAVPSDWSDPAPIRMHRFDWFSIKFP